jgi:hypothetical protein
MDRARAQAGLGDSGSKERGDSGAWYELGTERDFLSVYHVIRVGIVGTARSEADTQARSARGFQIREPLKQVAGRGGPY